MSNDEARAWWAGRRRTYNVGLVVAGIVAFACYVGALAVRCSATPGADVTLFTIFFQGILYVMAMGLANLFYNLGYWSERLIKPAEPARYRTLAYRSGFVFSIALPFLIPALILAFGCGPGESP